ncbi:hypothetical protein ED28_18395 [[Pantoea] beijingensis]|uniref:Transmembrane protein n=1 Tax=[Pantoea] beijingensis TaxID=1324864 RepID=A0A443I937_9GAMM|nr:hypothetical protein ED28_18395 [[Pantoea] beijingensis]
MVAVSAFVQANDKGTAAAPVSVGFPAAARFPHVFTHPDGPGVIRSCSARSLAASMRLLPEALIHSALRTMLPTPHHRFLWFVFFVFLSLFGVEFELSETSIALRKGDKVVRIAREGDERERRAREGESRAARQFGFLTKEPASRAGRLSKSAGAGPALTGPAWSFEG